MRAIAEATPDSFTAHSDFYNRLNVEKFMSATASRINIHDWSKNGVA